MAERTDVVIAGCGVGGLYAALNLAEKRNVVIISKAGAEECDSYLAQGGICMLHDKDDYDVYFEDTMKAGHYENNRESVDIMIRSSQGVIKDLIGYGVDFERTKDGELAFTREGAHSRPRILYHQDITGKEITSKLLQAVKAKKNISLYENVTMLDILLSAGGHHCRGIIASAESDGAFAKDFAGCKSHTADNGKKIIALESKQVIWACGGIGGLFEHSTNYPHLTGDALAIAIKHSIKLQNPDYIQIHPTTLYSTKKGRAFLISESVRGEGGILLNNKGERFVNELLPRDLVSDAIFKEMKKTGQPHVWLSMQNIPVEMIKTHFSHIYEHCLEEGFDCTKEPIPVVPAQHYFMGGVDIDKFGKTSMKGLYAVGETACNGVHGRNRLASNSLLESLVWAKRAANYIESELDIVQKKNIPATIPELSEYENTRLLEKSYAESVKIEIERTKQDRLKRIQSSAKAI